MRGRSYTALSSAAYAAPSLGDPPPLSLTGGQDPVNIIAQHCSVASAPAALRLKAKAGIPDLALRDTGMLVWIFIFFLLQQGMKMHLHASGTSDGILYCWWNKLCGCDMSSLLMGRNIELRSHSSTHFGAVRDLTRFSLLHRAPPHFPVCLPPVRVFLRERANLFSVLCVSNDAVGHSRRWHLLLMVTPAHGGP